MIKSPDMTVTDYTWGVRSGGDVNGNFGIVTDSYGRKYRRAEMQYKRIR